MPVIDQLWLVLVGLGSGFVGSIIGLGGGIIAVPVLTYAGFAPSVAAANSLFATLGNAASSTLVYSGQRRIRASGFVRLAAAAVPGTVLGGLASDIVVPSTFKLLFAILLASCAAYLFLGRRLRGRDAGGAVRLAFIGAGASFGAGIMSSFFGIGGGIVFVPVLVVLLGYTMRDSVGTSQAILVPVTLAAIASHVALGHPDYYHALLLMGGALAGGFAGARVSARLNDVYLTTFASAVMILAAIKLAADSVLES